VGRRWPALLFALGCPALLVLGAGGPAGATGGNSQVSLSINRGAPGRSVPPGFVGLGLEYKTIPTYTGGRTVDPVLVQLMHNIDPGQKPVLRFGGLSSDRTWWPVRGITKSPGLTYDLTPRWAADARALVDAINARAIVGVNLEADSTRITSTETRKLRSAIGSDHLAGVEIGNEPELYDVIPWYYVSHGHPIPWYDKHKGVPVFNRHGYSFQAFTADFARFRKALPPVPLAGPATGNRSWLDQLSQFLSVVPGLRWVTFHRYGLNGCVHDPTAASFASVPHLLTSYASRGVMQGVGKDIAIAHQHHAGFLIDEMNSVTCGGKWGVSNTFASALWALDALFGMVSDGVDGVSFHTFPRVSNALFDFNQSNGKWTGTVRPEYYGLLMFSEAAPPGARLLPISGTAGSDLRAWATSAPDHHVRLLLINDSLTSSYTAAVGGASSPTPATLERLQAPSASSTSGITLGGRSFGSQTSTGTLPGAIQTSPLRSAGGRYAVNLPAASAALLTIATG
jgi:hypothetical protein